MFLISMKLVITEAIAVSSKLHQKKDIAVLMLQRHPMQVRNNAINISTMKVPKHADLA